MGVNVERYFGYSPFLHTFASEIRNKKSNNKKLEICKYYAETYSKSLYSELKSKLSGYFKPLAMHLFLHPITFVAKMLKKSLKSFGGDEGVNFLYTRSIKTN